jgi:endoglycosylceramidase
VIDFHPPRPDASAWPRCARFMNITTDRSQFQTGADYTGSRRSGKAGFKIAPSVACARKLGLLSLILFTTGCATVGQHSKAGRPFSVFTASYEAASSSPAASLRAEGRHFVDPSGRVVILRGVNLSGDAKVPPFLPSVNESDLDRIADLGFNAVRLLFIWEAYEPEAGVYDDRYLARLQLVAGQAWERGLYVIIDIHQDGFSRHASRGAGDGFPRWAVSPRGRASEPDNSSACKNWPMLMALDPTTHKSFDDFFTNANGVRSRYLVMLDRIAGVFADTPGVVGYDFMNEPWGDERSELAPLYRDAARVVRARHPGSLAFLEGHVTTNCGLATRLPRPEYDGVVYAPHYYRPLTVLLGRWHGTTVRMNQAFANMNATSAKWNTPLFLGEFGVPPETRNAADFLAAIYDRMDAALASGAQWNYSPRWTESAKDGWNGEDFSIVDAQGEPRANFLPRPYPRCTAGTPTSFRFCERDRNGFAEIEFTWENRPELGATEIQLPRALFPGEMSVMASGPATFERDEARQILYCRASKAGAMSLRLRAG